MLDNSKIIAEFCPSVEDGDIFCYTEMLDRSKKKGNNGQRLLKTFYHRSREEFWEQWPTIQKLCDMSLVRACTRISPRSFKKVGKTFVRLVVETSLSENWAGMKSLYNRACGTTSPERKLWLFDVDVISKESEWLQGELTRLGKLAAVIPSKKGLHFISDPFDVRTLSPEERWHGIQSRGEISLHKDNPTNLYIPDGAD